MPDRIYMDNSATSFPKPPAVTEAMVRFAEDCGASAGRGAYAEAKACERLLADARVAVATLINAESPDRIVFTLNASDGLNIAIRGVLNTAPAGSHAIATALEHNSVLRPCNALAGQTGLEPEFIACDGRTGLVAPDDIRAAIRPETRMIVCVHVSNVTGTMQPIDAVAEIAREHDIPCLIDAAQSAGHAPIDVQALGADFVAFPGHKGCLGPLGTGVLYIRPGAEDRCKTMREGGTGTISEVATHPITMPDKYEIGSHNAIGIAGLLEGVRWLLDRDVAAIRTHDEQRCEQFLTDTDGVAGLSVYGPRTIADRSGVFSVNVDGLAPGELAARLEAGWGICTRPGMHCAPLAHKTIGTHPTGTCRLSFGPYTTAEQVATATTALAEVAAGARAVAESA
ncbi:MAG: aminotransferase class V-fold PLP-dependent enzyme [Planctomycetes bacterium]|jgi:cysteine desulfurase family protein|nr:aminotransferase class V-fold PLP-dependent enzyme [Phycisphaerae bacterium]NBB95312.1 aminotransferase class V-fold PLP-dependent enzyme [Planctomycetota bacterium]